MTLPYTLQLVILSKRSSVLTKLLIHEYNIPVYSITFGYASEYQLEEIAELTNAKVFDGRTDLLRAFKEVRGYN